jgi:hypothetical protein
VQVVSQETVSIGCSKSLFLVLWKHTGQDGSHGKASDFFAVGSYFEFQQGLTIVAGVYVALLIPFKQMLS